MKKLVSILLLSFFVAGCGSRVPKSSTAQKIIKKHFSKYGNKFPSSQFGNQKVTEVEVLKTEEIQKGLARSEAVVVLENGQRVKVEMTLIHKLPMGWRYQGWEQAQ